MLKIESIQNGIVIDHIPAGKGMDIYKLSGTGLPEAVHCPTAVRKK